MGSERDVSKFITFQLVSRTDLQVIILNITNNNNSTTTTTTTSITTDYTTTLTSTYHNNTISTLSYCHTSLPVL